MKISEEILLEEVKEEYARQLSTWVELTHKSYTFLQLNGLLLSVIFVGMSLVPNLFDNPLSLTS